ncbi:MAG TPA: PHB depolymerase family esterase [Pseudonocardia sp.]
MQKRVAHRARAAIALGFVAPLLLLIVSCAAPMPHRAAPPPPPPAAASPLPEASIPVNRVVTLSMPSGHRFAIVHHPVDTPEEAPLVVVLHGAYGSAQQARSSYGWDALADRNGFVVAYPNGAGPFWNAGDCCGTAHTMAVDDVEFLHELEDQLQQRDDIDPRRVYAVGMSNGAMMAYAWACGRPDDLAGIGPVAGALVAPCTPAPSVTVVAIHGTNDRNVPIDGGPGPQSVTHFRYPTLAASLAAFVAADGCDPTPVIAHRPSVQVSTWSCTGDRNVTLALVQGLGHEWPGARPLSRQRLVRQAPAALDATSFLWTNLRTSVLG